MCWEGGGGGGGEGGSIEQYGHNHCAHGVVATLNQRQ